ncbi:MAG: SusC/RagA family TonB-linked outer membrane protein, partial [Mariniphaga sp.]|nr:SusC/RagA family TonB-linked outer membrane protein [Mariniphaga sp.]
MKKKREWYSPGGENRKLNLSLKKMKLTLIFTMLVFLSFGKGFSQVTVSLQFEKTTIQELMETLENQTGYVFLYKDGIFDPAKRYSVDFTDEPFEEVLRSICATAGVDYEIRSNRQIILTEKKNVAGEKALAGIQQDRTVTGVVSDRDGQPLPGVTVVVKGTTRGTVTGSDGKFSLAIPDDAAVLQFSFVGMQTQEVPVDGRTTFTVVLEEEMIGIEEVVAVGYGTMKKSDLTGSVTSINEEDLRSTPSINVEQLMQGRAAGVQISSNTGMPGGGYTVRIRGVGTVNNNDPLYVIDGIPVFNDPGTMMSVSNNSESQNPMALLNSDDIKSVEILKDASAVAIYGARANNGVVMITTKRGQEGALKVNFETYHGFNKLVDNSDRMNSQEWAGWYASLLRNSGKENDANLPLLDQIAADPNATTYDWVKEGTQLGIINNYQLSLNGGNKISKYYAGANFYNEEGTIINSAFKRYSFRINSDHVLSNWIKVGNTLSLTRSDQDLGNTSLGNGAEMQLLMSIQPISPIYTDEGKYADPGPVADNLNHRIATLQNNKNTLLANRILGSLFADLTIFKGLVFHTSWSIDQIFSTHESWNPPYEVDQGRCSVLPENASLSANNRNSFIWFTDDYFSYSKTIGKHDINGTLGYSAQLASLKNWNANVSNFISDDYPYLAAGINQGNVGGGENRNALVSYFARANYIFDNRYLLTATVRRDGSSRFGENKRFGVFPAFSLGWRVSEEAFMKDLPEISNLKLRLSWGKSGGQEIGNYSAFNILG